MGKEILQQEIIKESTELDLRNFVSGIYYLMVFDGRDIFTGKIIKL